MTRIYTVKCKVCDRFAPAAGSRTNTCFECHEAGYKYCSSCGEIKRHADFHSNKAKWDSLNNRCKICECADNVKRKTEKYKTDDTYREHIKVQSLKYKSRYTPEQKQHFNTLRNEAYANDPEKRYAAAARWHNRRYNTIGSYSPEQWAAALEHFEYQCAYCGETSNLTVEHIVPISKRGTNYIYNLIPACAHCNGSKGAKEIVEWYTTREFYSEHRLLKIHAWYMDMQKHLPILKDGENPSC